jgi:hypothetical protein
MDYDPVTNDQWIAIRTQTLAEIRKGYVKRGFAPDRIRTLMMQAEVNVMKDIASFQASCPNWLTPRRQRILSEIR